MNNIIALAASLYIYTAIIVNILENGLYSKHLTFHYRVVGTNFSWLLPQGCPSDVLFHIFNEPIVIAEGLEPSTA